MGYVVSHLKFDGQNRIGIFETNDVFITGTSQVLCAASGATAYPITDIVSADSSCDGIRIDGRTAGLRTGTVVGNVVDLASAPPASIGIRLDNARAVSVTGNGVVLPNQATGTGIKVNGSYNRAVENVVRVWSTNASAVVASATGTGNTISPNTGDGL